MKHSATKSGLIVLLLVINAAAGTGNIHGKISGVRGNAVIYLDAQPGYIASTSSELYLMDQHNMVFMPHVLVVPVGSTVTFLNSDNVSHNILWPSIGGNRKLAHNLGTWKRGEQRKFTFQHPGVVPLLCSVHPEMQAYILVTPTPYFAEVQVDGTYRIGNVPDGEYTIELWVEHGKNEQQSVKVAGDTHLDLTMKK